MRKLLPVFVLGISLLVVISFSSQKALAEDSATSTATPTLKFRQEIRSDVKDIKQTVRGGVKDNRLAEASSASTFKQKACEAHLKVIKQREGNIADKGGFFERRWDRIATAVEAYYTNKLVPSGKTLSNYDALVSDVNTKKAALTPLIDKVKSDSASLTCDKDQARTQFQTLKTDWVALLAGVKSYRQSVINLVKGVRSIAGPVPSLSVSPTVAPTQEVSPTGGEQ